jgi:hypothetical protein
LAKIHYGKLTPVSVVASTAAAGYPANNVALESISRPWNSTSSASTTLTLTLAAAQLVNAVLLQDVNFSSCLVEKSPDGSSFSSVGTLNTFADRESNRRRGLILVADANVKAIRLTMSGTPTDGLAYWRIGAAYLFNAASTMPHMPQYNAQLNFLLAKVLRTLPNRRVAQATLAPGILELSLAFDRRYDEDVQELFRRAEAGTIGLELVPNNFPELVLPVLSVVEQQGETFNYVDHTACTIEVRESV